MERYPVTGVKMKRYVVLQNVVDRLITQGYLGASGIELPADSPAQETV